MNKQSNPVKPPIAHEQIIDALRAELQESGGLLNLLDRQQEAIHERHPASVAEAGRMIAAQRAVLRSLRAQREYFVSDLTPKPPARPSLFQMTFHFPPLMRPLVEALAAEISRLIAHLDRRTKQNHLLFARTLGAAPNLS